MTEHELLTMAADRYSAEDFGAAGELCTEVIGKSPRQAHAYYILGSIAFNERKFPKARDHYMTAFNISPKRAEYCNAAGLAWLELGDYGEAAAHIERAIRLSSRPEFHNNLGTVLKRQGRITDAIRSYKHAIKQSRSFFEAYYNLGNCYRIEGQSSEAIS